MTADQAAILASSTLWVHKGNGHTYRIVGSAVSATNGETDGMWLVLYRREPPELGTLPYARTVEQFIERFVPA